jgi:hypothetical protein
MGRWPLLRSEAPGKGSGHPREAIADRDDPVSKRGCAGSATANGSGGASLVAMVQPADAWKGDNVACGRRLYGPGLWTILG